MWWLVGYGIGSVITGILFVASYYADDIVLDVEEAIAGALCWVVVLPFWMIHKIGKYIGNSIKIKRLKRAKEEKEMQKFLEEAGLE